MSEATSEESMEAIEIEHARFGRIRVGPDELYRFDGIPGFPSAERFVLMQSKEPSLFMWLVSLDLPELAFPVMDPTAYFPDYGPEIAREHLDALRAKGPEDVDILAIVSARPGEVVANLAAPVVVSASSRRGRQLILEEGLYATRQPLLPQPPSSGSGR